MKRKRENKDGPRAVLPVDAATEAGRYLMRVQEEAAQCPSVSFFENQNAPVSFEDPFVMKGTVTVDPEWENRWMAGMGSVESTGETAWRSKAAWKVFVTSTAPSKEGLEGIDLETRTRLLWYFRSWVRKDMSMNERKWMVLLVPLEGGDVGTLRILGRKCRQLAIELQSDHHSPPLRAKSPSNDNPSPEKDPENTQPDIMSDDLTVSESCILFCSILVRFYRQLDFAHHYPSS